MNNFIRNIKEHKIVALVSLGVFVALAAIVVSILANSGEPSSSPTNEAAPEISEYFADSDYPVSITRSAHALAVKIDSPKADDLKWDVFVLPGEQPLTDNLRYQDNSLYLELTPVLVGYATVCFSKSAEIGGLSCEKVRIEMDVYTAENDDGTLSVCFSAIRQSNSGAGADDTETPFVLKGDRVLMPAGGDWTLRPEEGASADLYAIMKETDENGTECFIVVKNVMSAVSADETNGTDPLSYGLLLRSASLNREYHLNIRMTSERTWELYLTDAAA